VPQRRRVVAQVTGAVLLPVQRVDRLGPPVLRRVLHEDAGQDDADGHDDALPQDVGLDLAGAHVERGTAQAADHDDERHGAVGPAAVDEPGEEALPLRVPLGHDVDAARVDHPGADAAQDGVPEVGLPDRAGVGQDPVPDDAADDAADDDRPPDVEDAPVAGQPGEDLHERLEDHEEGERPERLGQAPVMRGLKRAGHRAPGVLQQPGQAHGQPGRHDRDPPAVAEDVLWRLTDPEHPAGLIGYDLIREIARIGCSAHCRHRYLSCVTRLGGSCAASPGVTRSGY